MCIEIDCLLKAFESLNEESTKSACAVYVYGASYDSATYVIFGTLSTDIFFLSCSGWPED